MSRRLLLIVIACGALAAGCASPGYDTGRVRTEIERAGLSDRQAGCVTDALENTFDARQLGSYSSPTQHEIATTQGIVAKCRARFPG